MQQCPKCGSGVPDGRTTCQICSAALGEAAGKPAGPIGLQLPETRPPEEAEAAPNYLTGSIPGIDSNASPQGLRQPSQPSLGGGEARVSLTGEVLEATAPSPRTTGPLAGSIPGAGGPMGAGPRPSGPLPQTAPARARVSGPISDEEAPRKKTSPLVTCLVIFVVLAAAAGAGGYWFYQTRVLPPATAVLFLQSMKMKDWKTAYKLIELPAAQKSMVTEDAFVKGMSAIGSLAALTDYKVNDVKIDGDTTKVNVTLTVEGKLFKGGPQTQTTDIPVKRFEGGWKVDASSGGLPMPGAGR
jgi:hypothetical protein